MDDKQLQDIADRVIAALENLAPAGPGWWTVVGAFTPVAALLAAAVAAVVGYRNLRQQQSALALQWREHEQTLAQNTTSDARSEWWRRTQWALQAAASDNAAMYAFGTGMLDLLARSELADAHDKELLDAVWQASSTRMSDAGIEHLIRAARDQADLSEAEAASVHSFLGPLDVPGVPGAGAGAVPSGGRAAPKDRIFDTLRREILAARLKTTLDGQLHRQTSRTVERLAQMQLPPIPNPRWTSAGSRPGPEDPDDGTVAGGRLR